MALRYHSHRHGGGFHRIMPLPPPQPPTHHISSSPCPTLFDLRISLCRQYPNRRTGGPQSINSAWGVVPPLNVEPSSFDAGTIDRAETGGGDPWSSKGVRFGRDGIWGRPRASSHTTIIWGRTDGTSRPNRLSPCSSIIIQSRLFPGDFNYSNLRHNFQGWKQTILYSSVRSLHGKGVMILLDHRG